MQMYHESNPAQRAEVTAEQYHQLWAPLGWLPADVDPDEPPAKARGKHAADKTADDDGLRAKAKEK